MVSFISEKFKPLRKRKSFHKRGSELLMDMLPGGRSASPPVLPLSREQSQDDGQYPRLDPLAVIEVEANNPEVPELDSEALGPQIQEVETSEPVLEVDSKSPLAEVHG